MLYGLPLTTSPAARVKLASVVDTLPVSLIATVPRSEEHTSELQSLTNLVCRLLLEKTTCIPGCSEWTAVRSVRLRRRSRPAEGTPRDPRRVRVLRSNLAAGDRGRPHHHRLRYRGQY